LDPDKLVLVDGFFELPSFFEQIDMSLELGPTSETIRASNLKLGVGEGLGTASIYQVLRLVFQVAKIGAIREDARSVGQLVRHSELLSCKRPLSTLRAERSFAKAQVCSRWASTLPADRMRPSRYSSVLQSPPTDRSTVGYSKLA
jgi:hypothetical protein